MKSNNILWIMVRAFCLLPFAFCLIMLSGCKGDEYEYCKKYQCYFSFNLTYHPATDISSCINPLASGTFCMVSKTPLTTGYKLNISLYGKSATSENITTAVSCILGSNNGLIIGCSSLNDGELFAYDQMCPNCLNDGIYKGLQWDNSGNWVKCTRCSRSYDLSNSGFVVKGESGDKLLRYRASSTSSILFVGN